MALTPWHRTALTAGSMALALVVILPPRPLPEPGEAGFLLFPVDRVWPSGMHYSQTLSRTLENLRLRVLAARMADSLFALAATPRAMHSANHAMTLVYEPALGADSAHAWLEMLERELALAPRGPSGGMPLIVALRFDRRKPGVQTDPDRDWAFLRFVSPRPERPACFLTFSLAPARRRYVDWNMIQRDARTGAPHTRMLDWCLLYARFGAPGDLVGKWAAPRLQVSRWWYGESNLTYALDPEGEGSPRGDLPFAWSDPLSGACARDWGGPCLKVIGLAGDPSLRWEGHGISVRRAQLLARLMTQDPARFEQFWRSTDPPAAALAAAYGKPAGQIVADFRRSVVPPTPSGRGIPAGTLLSSLGWAVIALGLGVLVAWRQQVR